MRELAFALRGISLTEIMLATVLAADTASSTAQMSRVYPQQLGDETKVK